MRQILGFPVLAAGLALGAYSTFPHLFAPPPFPATSGAGSGEIGTTQSRVKMFAPSSAFRLAALVEPREATPIIPPVPKPAVRGARMPALETASVALDTTTASSWQTSVTTAEIAPLARGTERPMTRDQLARAIQHELKRVGCYGGIIDGSWGSGSKRAMSAFMERANASLPLDAPDDILLSLIRGNAAVCGTGCPKGQSLSGTGRCIPDAIVAQSARKHGGTTTEVAWTAEVTLAAPGAGLMPRREPLPGRMSVGATLPASGGNTETALLEDGLPAAGADATAGPVTAAVPPDANPAPARVSRPRADRSRPYRRSSRSVQNLFMHPLGRM